MSIPKWRQASLSQWQCLQCYQYMTVVPKNYCPWCGCQWKDNIPFDYFKWQDRQERQQYPEYLWRIEYRVIFEKPVSYIYTDTQWITLKEHQENQLGISDPLHYLLPLSHSTWRVQNREDISGKMKHIRHIDEDQILSWAEQQIGTVHGGILLVQFRATWSLGMSEKGGIPIRKTHRVITDEEELVHSSESH